MISEDRLVSVYRDTVRPLYAFVARRVRSNERVLVEDIVQETYLRAVEHWSRRGLPDRPLAWLQTVAGNLLVDNHRRRRPERLEGCGDGVPDERVSNAGADEVVLLRQGLSRMPAHHARLLEDFHLEDKSVRAIAGQLRISERAVEGRLRRAREALRHGLRRLLEGGMR